MILQMFSIYGRRITFQKILTQIMTDRKEWLTDVGKQTTDNWSKKHLYKLTEVK